MKPFLYSILIILAFSTCKKRHKCHDVNNPECENYDPCFGKQTINTYFLVREGTGSFPPNPPECGENIPYDTLNNVWAEFEVPSGNTSNCTYEWRIGNDTRVFTGTKFQLSFENWLNQGNYMKPLAVNLTIRRPLDGCNSINDTLKTISRNIYFMWDTAKRKSYVGYFKDKPTVLDTIIFLDIEVNQVFRGVQYQQGGIFLIGLPTSYNDTCEYGGSVAYSCNRGYKYSYVKFNNGVDERRGFLTSIKKELTGYEKMRFTWGVSKPGYLSEYEFTGKRIW